MASVCRVLLCLLQILLLSEENHGLSHSIVHPKMFRIDVSETVVVDLHGYGDQEVQITSQLSDYPYRRSIYSAKRTMGNAQEPISFTMRVSHEVFYAAQTIQNKKVEMLVSVRFPSGAYTAIAERILVYVTGESDYIFIQTERPIYKPEEDVQIRVIPLNLEMQPQKSEDVEITVQTPDNIGVWKAVKRFPRNDFVEVTYSIPNDPPLGIWHVFAKINNNLHTSNSTADFKVEKYVLPTYDVTVELTQSYVKPGEYIYGSLKAMYSYGEPVVGTYTITAFVTLPNSERQFEFYAKPSSYLKRPGQLSFRDNGKKSFKVPTSKAINVTSMPWADLISEKAAITVRVSVLGQAEGIVESDEKSGILITNSPYKLDLSQTSKFFIPSFTHVINVMVRDIVTNLPVAGVPVEVTTDGTEPLSGITDGSGVMEVEVGTRNANQIRSTIRTAKEGLPERNQAEAVLTLKKYNSHSGAYLRISGPSHANVNSNIYLRFRPRNFNRVLEITYLVLSRGRILLSGRKRVVRGETSQMLSVTRKMSPGIRVVAYFMAGDEVISDSLSIYVSDVCLSEELFINVARETVKPGDSVEMSLQGEGNAMVGVSAVDRASYFLFSDGRLNRKKMFDMMSSFDFGCSLAGGRDGLSVFKEAGLALTGNGGSTPSVTDPECPDDDESKRRKRSAELEDPELVTTNLKCYKDGRLPNLAKENCDTRNRRVLKWDFSEEKKRTCLDGFLEGCKKGEKIRSTMEIRKNLQRTGYVVIDRGSQRDNVKRHRFKEGWIWKTVSLNHGGEFEWAPRATHDITTFDIDAVSVHDTEGFCIAKPAQLKVFKDFFIQLYLPYSVKVAEQVQLRAAIFNYHETMDRNVALLIKSDENLCTHASTGEWFHMATLDVKSQGSASFSFTVIPLLVPDSGEMKIEIQASSTASNDTAGRDHIIKHLKVEESGSQEEFSGSFLLDPVIPDRNSRIEFHFPDDDVVPGSKKCWIYGHMSFLGPIIEFEPIGETPKNLAGAITMPHGCGEQNMWTCGPNVFAFKYLKSKGDRSVTTAEKIRTYIIDGYTRQLSHRNRGIWSVYKSRSPTIWLNAYVDKVFLQARSIWPDMDVNPICKSLDWILKQQKGDGRFSEVKLAYYYRINVAEGGDVALTAYVLIAMTETEILCPDASLKSRLDRAIQTASTFLRRTVYDSRVIPYTAAIVAYALALVSPYHSSTSAAMERLLNMKIDDGNEIYWQALARNKIIPDWQRQHQSPIDIEATSYALLAEVAVVRDLGFRVDLATVERINKITRWLVGQRNDRGGVQTSQTTVVAIQAMTEYGIWINGIEFPPRNPFLRVRLAASGTPWERGHEFLLDGRNEFYRKEVQIPMGVINSTRTVEVAVEAGEGRGSMSYKCVYRLTRGSEVCDFNITASTEMIGYRDETGEGEAEPGKGMNVIKLLLILSKFEAPASSMAIIEIGLISGFRPVEQTLEALTLDNVVDGVVDRYEVSDHKVVLYVESIPVKSSENEPLRIAFTLQQAVTVNVPNPAKILVYDYYKPMDKCSKFYAVPEGSPMLRTSCAPTSVDGTNRQQCRCAEGGCPRCRVRQEQLEKTCGRSGMCYGSCKTGCVNLHQTICAGGFGFLAELESIDHDSMPSFVKLTVVVKEILFTKSEDTSLRTEQIRTFIIRKDCFERCHDVDLKTLQNPSYFVTGRTFLIAGKEPERSILSSGQERFSYYLDRDAVLERSPTVSKCANAERKRRSCEGSHTENCLRIKKKLTVCDNLDALRRGIHSLGCD